MLEESDDPVVKTVQQSLKGGRKWKVTEAVDELVQTQQIIMVELTVPYESKMEEAHAFKEGKYLDLTKELKKDGYEAKIMPVEIGARGFVGSSANSPNVAIKEQKP
ncbi:reverse transcriptase [Plakobranchus ocellatus]|uniref:Reverse transcriptase n=1 Tax=Plakobranchus ocellatus TaxID=259542 RepID=A0AAV4AJM5_9GAST|nr:reverse transcriptase [Plakobranchus ocellatus]